MKYLLFREQDAKKYLMSKEWLDKKKISYEVRNISNVPLNEEELKGIVLKSGKKIKKFFVKDEISFDIDNISIDEGIEILLKDKNLLKLPILVCEEKVLIGFKEKKWDKNLCYLAEGNNNDIIDWEYSEEYYCESNNDNKIIEETSCEEVFSQKISNEENDKEFEKVVEDVKSVRKASLQGKSIEDISREKKLDKEYVTRILMTAEGYTEDDDFAVAHLVILG